MAPSRSRPLLLVAVVAMATALVAGACGGGDEENPDALPRPQTSTFGSGALDETPLHPGSEAIQEPNETGEVVAATYVVSTAQPRTVAQFYRRVLEEEGWDTLSPVTEDGRDVWRGEWERGDQVLEVSSAPATALETGNYENPTQYSLVLRPT